MDSLVAHMQDTKKKSLFSERKRIFVLNMWWINAYLMEVLGLKDVLGPSSENRTDQFTLASAGNPIFKAKAIISLIATRGHDTL